MADQFYPTIEADTTDIADPTLGGRAVPTELQMDCTATEWEVYKALKNTKLDKCPRADEIPNRFLLAIGKLLV